MCEELPSVGVPEQRAALSPLARVELFIGRVVAGGAVGAAIAIGLHEVGLDMADTGNTGVACAALGIIYAVSQRRKP